LGFEFFKESYAGSVKEITLGKGDKAVTVGGETCYPFYQFEGDMPHKAQDRDGNLGHGTRRVA
jgi:acetyl-CoA decarbonylase/synthase complex subunit delta